MSARRPADAPPPRIEPLAVLPVFLRLGARRAIVAGASEGALWKAELLAAAGAQVDVYAGDAEGAALYEALAAQPPAGRVALHARPWREEDLTEAAVALADLEGEEAVAFARAAQQAGVPCNIIDKPALCGFQFGAIVNRSPLVISISTDGAAPVFGQAVRARIEAVLPRGLKAWAEAARDWRPAVQARALPFALRRRFWERFTALAISAPETAPQPSQREALLSEVDRLSGAAETGIKGRVTLVGAGPGDPELLTLKAMRALQAADVILYDDLVSPEVLELARREARRMVVGKTGHGPSCKQEDIHALMLKLARQGRHVVRLKSGDPAVFGRAGEEIAACRAAGIPVTIVPGMTAAQGAAAALGVSLTERSQARRLQFVTGHGQDGALPDDMNWGAIADPKAATAIYMPRKTLADFVDKALAAGLDPDTPAVAIASATRPDQAHVHATISTLPHSLATLPAGQPVLVLFAPHLDRAVQDHGQPAPLPDALAPPVAAPMPQRRAR